MKCVIVNFIFNVFFGVECLYDDEGFVYMFKIVDNFWKLVYGSNMVDFLLLLKYFLNKVFLDFCMMMEIILGVVMKMFENNREIYVGGKVCNIVDSVINVVEREMEKEKEDCLLGEDILCMVLVFSDE